MGSKLFYGFMFLVFVYLGFLIVQAIPLFKSMNLCQVAVSGIGLVVACGLFSLTKA